MRTRLVVKLVIVLVLLLTVVLYKMNDFYREEKLAQANNQIRKQIVSTKTSVSGQIGNLRNVLSSYEIEIKENLINWVQLDPFFLIARLQKKPDGSYAVLQLAARSGTLAERWNASYLEKALFVQKGKSDKSILARLFKDKSGGKFLALIYNIQNDQQLAVVGAADYFQKYFDLDRGSGTTSALITTEQILAAHSESEYVATVSNENQLSTKKYIIAKEEISGTNLIAVSYVLKKEVAAAWVAPWSIAGLIFGFGLVLVGLLFYGLEPLEKKIERYKKQERAAVFNEVVNAEVKANSEVSLEAKWGANAEVKIGNNFLQAMPARSELPFENLDNGEFEEITEEATLNGPVQQAIFNLDSCFKRAQILVEKDILTQVKHSFYYTQFIKAFENILKNAIEAVSEKKAGIRKIIVRAYDKEDHSTVIEIQDNGIGLGLVKDQIDKVWQPFFTTKDKSLHSGLGLTEAVSIVRRCGADLQLEALQPEGMLVRMTIKNENKNESKSESKFETKSESKKLTESKNTAIEYTQPSVRFQEDDSGLVLDAEDPDLDLDKVLTLDDAEAEKLFVSQKINLTDKNQESASAKIRPPQFTLEKKTFQMDQIKVTIRPAGKA